MNFESTFTVYDNAVSMANEENGTQEEAAVEGSHKATSRLGKHRPSNHDRKPSSSEDEEEDEEEETEPSLKYTKLTGSLGHIYRNRDSTSTSLVSGDKMVGTTQLSLEELLMLR